MTFKLYIVRHAKAMDKAVDMTDAQRELSTTGLRQATHVGQYLKSEQMIPNVIICSTANRALTTATIIAEQLDISDDSLILKDTLYEASVRTLLQLVNVFQSGWKNVVLVAHNPGLHYFVEYITGDVLDKLGTGGVAEICFELDDWEMVSQNTGQLKSYYKPNLK